MNTFAAVVLIIALIAIVSTVIDAIRNWIAKEDAIDAKITYWDGIIASR